MPAKHLVMLIDLRRCIGCQVCTVSCKAENNLPNGVWWNSVVMPGGSGLEVPQGVYPHLQMQYLTLACQQCENPPCVKVCPVAAITQSESDGVVALDSGKCIGCRYCIAACPYTGVLQFNGGQPRYYLPFAVGDTAASEHDEGVVEKCTFCAHRLALGQLPACIECCPTMARHFGDLNDPASEVSQLLQRRSHVQLLAEMGLKPSVYFLT